MSESCEGGALVADGFWVKGEGGDMVVNPDVAPSPGTNLCLRGTLPKGESIKQKLMP